MRRRGLAKAGAVACLLAGVVALASCGGGGGGGSEAGEVLFDGTAGELVPHPTGRRATHRVTLSTEGDDDSSSVTSVVASNGADGEFRTHLTSAEGSTVEVLARDTGDEILLESVLRAVPEGGTVEEAVDPPAVVVRTPVVAGEAIETSFARVLDVAIEVNGRSETTQALFVGEATRTPTGLETVDVPAGKFRDAIRYAVSASGSTRVEVAGVAIDVSLEEEGEELLAPGVGSVREALDISVRARTAETSARLVTELESFAAPAAEPEVDSTSGRPASAAAQAGAARPAPRRGHLPRLHLALPAA